MDRLQLSEQLHEIADNVYFQEPPNTGMKYPCILYASAKLDPRFAGNQPYLLHERFTVTVIDRDPDSEIPKKVAHLPMCRHSAYFVAENLHHNVFDIFI